MNTEHLSHYITLIGILGLSFCGLILFSYDRFFQLSVAFSLSASYFSWGIVHHILHKDLSIEVVVEYFVISLLGLSILLSLILRA